MVGTVGADDGGVAAQQEVDARVRNQIDLKEAVFVSNGLVGKEAN